MNYRKYLETFIGKSCELMKDDAWCIYFLDEDNFRDGTDVLNSQCNVLVLKEVYDDFVILEDLKNKRRTATPSSLLKLQGV